jgi:hypothetical protein
LKDQKITSAEDDMETSVTVIQKLKGREEKEGGERRLSKVVPRVLGINNVNAMLIQC